MKNPTGQFYSSLGLLILLNAIIKPVWIFGIDRQVQLSVGTLEYGHYFSLFNLSIVFSFLLDWGLTAFFNRQLSSRQEQFIGRAGDFLFIKLLFAVLYAAIVLIVAFITGVDRWDIITGVILIQIFTSLFLFFRAIITAEQWFRTDAWLSVLDKTLMILLCGSLLFFPAIFGNMTITRFLWLQTSCTAFAMLSAAVILLVRRVKFSFRLSFSFLNRTLFLSALPYAIIVLLMSVHYRMDGFLLERIHPNGAHEAGMYAAAYRLLDAAAMTGFLFSSFLLPYAARQWSEQKPIADVVITSRHFLTTYAIGISCMVIFLAPWIQQLLYHNNDAEAMKVLQWCLPSLVGYLLVSIYGTVLTATGHIISFCIITFFAVLINIILNLCLIPSMGAKGCCMAALLSHSICGLATMVYAKRATGIGFQLRSILIYLFIALILSLYFYRGNEWGLNNWLLITMAVIITIGIMIFTKLFRPAKWLASLKKSHL
jgi:O-antigen/teichoic acid export membrane protein